MLIFLTCAEFHEGKILGRIIKLKIDGDRLHSVKYTDIFITNYNPVNINMLNAYDVISRHAVAVMQWPVCLITSCCSSVLTYNL